MTKRGKILPMKHRVAVVVYPGFELLDATGPASVFGNANGVLPPETSPLYEIEFLSASGGGVTSSSGVSVVTRAFAEVEGDCCETILVSGAEASVIRSAMRDPAVAVFLQSRSKNCIRLASVCAGSFILAAAGLLEGKRATTHWAATAALATHFPSVRVEPDALYTADAGIWTSAGVTTGIDMALAMVAEDLGTAVANKVARHLVLYLRRPGNQSQFSPMLQAQIAGDHPFEDLINWIHDNLHRSLDAPALAARAGLSERSFYRKFSQAMGQTPASFVENLRLDKARSLLAHGHSLKVVARSVGFSSSAKLSQKFERKFGLSLALYREVHSERHLQGGLETLHHAQ
ncbi:GlxA family transcriptional regulator [Devosia albogilva]|uniref:GlxA family transcriptional regulator n=1 Tax=Devosia albogilva TaxID=429726 RepID=A0ABW5QIF1_9HYPH